jgi:membrane protein DedA with SNARE-associated domain
MDDLIQQLLALPEAYILLTLFVAAFVENVFPPIPGDTVTIIGGALVGFAAADFAAVVVATTIGSCAGFMTLYAAGRHWGRDLFKRPGTRFLQPQNLAKIEAWFYRHANWVLLANRFLAGMRSLVAIVAGISGKAWWHVLILAGISVLVWNGLLIGAGYLLGSNWQLAEEIVQTYSTFIMLLFALFIIVLLMRFWWKRNKKEGSSS